MLTIQEALDLAHDNLFKRPNGEVNTQFARVCYSIDSMGQKKGMDHVAAKLEIENKMSPADYKVLVGVVKDLIDYGLRAGGRCQCPQCRGTDATFIALADDRFFRPTVGDIRKGRDDRRIRGDEDASGSETEAV